MDRPTAQQVERLLRTANGCLNDAVLVVRESCNRDEFEEFRGRVGEIMGAVVVDLLQPLYAQHPEVTPEALRRRDGSDLER